MARTCSAEIDVFRMIPPQGPPRPHGPMGGDTRSGGTDLPDAASASGVLVGSICGTEAITTPEERSVLTCPSSFEPGTCGSLV